MFRCFLVLLKVVFKGSHTQGNFSSYLDQIFERCQTLGEIEIFVIDIDVNWFGLVSESQYLYKYIIYYIKI